MNNVHLERVTGLTIDRKRDTAAEEALRIKDVLGLRGAYLDRNITILQEHVAFRGRSLSTNTALAGLLIGVFFISTLLARRRLR